MKTEQKRGELTQQVKDKSKSLFGYEIDVTILRLLPYIQFVMMNDQKVDQSKISDEEKDILYRLQEYGHIMMKGDKIEVSKEFWDIVSELLYMSYVDITK